MTNELAKQLKDAGFPIIELAPNAIAVGSQKARCAFCGFPFLEIDNRRLYMLPIAEVFTEVLGDRLFNVKRYKHGWKAYTYAGEDDMIDIGEGETMDEALGNLWLNINNGSN